MFLPETRALRPAGERHFVQQVEAEEMVPGEPVAPGDLLIPRVLHQTWKTADVPAVFHEYRASWRRHHPAWSVRLWTDADNRRLVADHYPWFLERYDAYRYPIQRADAARYFILHRHGGLYVDLDFECLRSVEPLLAPGKCTLGMEPAGHARAFGRERILCNAFMAAPPEHPFTEAVLHALPGSANAVPIHDRAFILETTGPFLLTRVFERFEKREAVAVLDSRLIYPLTMQEADVLRGVPLADVEAASAMPDAEALRRRLTGAYAVHYHVGTWWRPRP